MFSRHPSSFVIFICLLFPSWVIAQSNLVIDSLQRSLKVEKTDSLRVKTLNNLAYEFFSIDPKKSITIIEQSLSIAFTLHLKKQILDAYYIKCIGYDMLGNNIEAERNSKKLIELALAYQDTLYAGKGYFIWGNLKNRTSNGPESISHFNKALLYFRKAKSDVDIANMYSRLGTAYNNLGNYETAIQFFIKALAEFGKLKDLKGESVTLHSMGNTFMFLKDYSEAKKYYLKSLKIKIKFNNLSWIGTDYMSLGNAYTETDSLEKAFDYYKKALNTFERIPLTEGIASTNENIGLLLMKKHQVAKAVPYFLKSITLNRTMDAPYPLASSLRNTANAYINLNKLDEAALKLNEASKLAKKMDNRKFKLDLYESLVNYYKARYDFKNISTYMEKYTILKDSIFNDTKSKQIAGLQIEFESEQKEAENNILKQNNDIQRLTIEKQNQTKQIMSIVIFLVVLLTFLLYWLFKSKEIANKKLVYKTNIIDTKNAILEATQLKLQQSLGEKEVLLKEIHHRVKNNLQLVSSLLSIQARATAQNLEVKDFLYKSQNRVQSMALIHETLYLSDDVSKVDFQQYLIKLTSHLFHSFDVDKGNIETTIQAHGIVLDIETVIPLGLILAELINNALKHAFPKGNGKINITLQDHNDEMLELIVFDNGIGLPENYSEKEATLGMQLINDLTVQLYGNLMIENLNGTRVTIRFPKDYLRITII